MLPSTYDDDLGATLDSPIGLLGVSVGGSGADMSATGPGFVYQSSLGAAFSAVALPVTYVSSTGADQTVAIQTILDGFTSAARLVLGPGTFLITDTLIIDQDGVCIVGMGSRATIVNFVPTSGGKPCFSFIKSGQILYDCGISELRISSTETTFHKVAVRLTDTSLFLMWRVKVGPEGFWTGNASIALQVRGREHLLVGVVDFAADQPISIEDNPNHTIDFDHMHFWGMNLIAKSDDTQPCIKIASGVNVTQSLIDGRQAWNHGSYGLYWNDTTTAQFSDGMVIKNARWEQSTSGKHCIYIVAQHGYRRLQLENIQIGGTVKGIYLRNIDHATIKSCIYAHTLEALNIDGTVELLEIKNTFFLQGSSTSTTGSTRIFGNGKESSGPTPGYLNELWVSSANANLANQVLLYTLQTTGNIGVGVASSTTVGEMVLARSDGEYPTKVQVTNAAVGTAALAQAVLSSDTGTLSITQHGSGRVVSRWGEVLGGWAEILANVGVTEGMAIGTLGTRPLKLGTASLEREFFSGSAKTLTESSATGICDIAIANNTVIGGTLFYTIDATDATDYQTLRGRVSFTAVSKAGTLTSTLGTPEEINALSAGTLTNTCTITNGAAKITLNLNAVSSLAQTILRANFHVLLDGGTAATTPL